MPSTISNCDSGTKESDTKEGGTEGDSKGDTKEGGTEEGEKSEEGAPKKKGNVSAVDK